MGRLPALPAAVLAMCIAVAAAYVIADLVSRGVTVLLRSILGDHHDEVLVGRPRRVARVVIFLTTLAALTIPALTLAGYPVPAADTPDALLQWLLHGGLRIAVIAVAAYVAIRMGSATAQRFERELSAGTGLDTIERTKRAQTLGRLIQKTLTVVVMGIAALMIMRELSVDITPALTGAGILGLAVGFGAQTLVRDVISGFLLIMEDQIRVGDVATVNGQGGLVEQVNLRTIVLRDEQGAVHVFPNGEVKTLANQSKDFSYYVLSVAIGFDDDPDVVAEAMREAAATLMTDAAFQSHILEPLDVYGVDAFDAGHMVMKARIKTVPLKQWTVGRELRKRIARVFHERGITAPVPQMQVSVRREDEAGPDRLRQGYGESAGVSAKTEGPPLRGL